MKRHLELTKKMKGLFVVTHINESERRISIVSLQVD